MDAYPVKTIDAHANFNAAATPTDRPRVERRRRLSPAALAVANRKVGRATSPIVIVGMVRVVDFLVLSAIGLALQLLFADPVNGSPLGLLMSSLGMALSAVLCFQTARLYEIQAFRRRPWRMGRLIASWVLAIVLFIGASFVARRGTEVSLAWLEPFFFVGLTSIVGVRLVLRALLDRWTRQGRLDRRTIVVGADETGAQLIETIKAQHGADIDILGVFDDRNDDRVMEMCADVPKLGKVGDIVEFARRTRVDLVVFALPMSAETRILQMLKKLWVLPVDVRLSAHNSKLRFHAGSYSYLGEVPTIDVFKPPITDWELVTKWLFDHIVGFLMLVVALPVMGIIALAIKLDSPGPVLFRQKRFGFNNERIDVFKFRSMYHDQADPAASKVVTRDDPRVTRVGRFIRKSSLDELPQLFNVVFKGNLSLVGPRPHATQGKLQNRLFDEVVDGYYARHRIKPGITGWAQINGWRGEVDTDEKIQKRVEHDLYYIENWSVLFDLQIMLMTPLALLTKNENAY
jgi:Undecaprenyl-phosphate glucose phosphotransferase